MSVADRMRQVAPGGARTAPRVRYLSIAEHGLIGDLHTGAFVGTDVGSTGEQLGDFG